GAEEEAGAAAEEDAKVRAEEEARAAAEERAREVAAARSGTFGGNGDEGNGVTVGREGRIDGWTLLGWSLVGGGALLVGGGAAMHWKAFDSADEADALDPFLPDYNSRFDDRIDSARTWQGLSVASYVLGAVSILAGLDVLFSWPLPVRRIFGSDVAGWRLLPGVTPDGSAGLTFELPLP
ncbi:MAG: hypothetical protein FJ109_09570, partial [Deltaproteobacteria bacterium]|nr:hypothetical protein [Deltaproteobacteria bacterium]